MGRTKTLLEIAGSKNTTPPKENEFEQFIQSLTVEKDRIYAIVKINRSIFCVTHPILKWIFFRFIAGSTNYKEYVEPLKSYIKWNQTSTSN